MAALTRGRKQDDAPIAVGRVDHRVGIREIKQDDESYIAVNPRIGEDVGRASSRPEGADRERRPRAPR